jgi:predicted nucleic acid-binding protein
MIVVSNTSPLNYLILINVIEVLPKLYKQVFIPAKVLEELADPRSPQVVQAFAKSSPTWLIERTPAHVDSSLKLHAGEAHAIALALELKADRLLIDERRGYEAAKARGLHPIGILGVLYEASGNKLVDLAEDGSFIHRELEQWGMKRGE